MGKVLVGDFDGRVVGETVGSVYVGSIVGSTDGETVGWWVKTHSAESAPAISVSKEISDHNWQVLCQNVNPMHVSEAKQFSSQASKSAAVNALSSTPPKLMPDFS